MPHARLHALWRRTSRLGAAVAAAAAAFGATAANIDLNDTPLFSTTASVPGNLILALSVEWPTATTPAYPSTTAYSTTAEFLGYFDPNKCYSYVYDSTTPSASYFNPVGNASSHACVSSTTSQRWSGNYLNWASMQTLDAFRWVLTGGYRSTDTTTTTILTKTNALQDSSVMPQKTIDTSLLAGATPFTGAAWTSGATTRVRYLGTRMWITSTNTGNSGTGTASSTTSGATAYNGHNSYVASTSSSYAAPGTTYELYINVKVCDTAAGVETNCKQYDTNWKPEGLMQKYATKLRYSAFGYLNHNGTTSQQRDGGVMRARMKYIGPTVTVPGGSPTSNGYAEWNSTTGVMVANPDSDDATATVNAASNLGWTISVPNSGVMNYLNKFGNGSTHYKSKDPVTEMYYAALRYFKNLGNVSSYSDISGAGSAATAQEWVDYFPVITSDSVWKKSSSATDAHYGSPIMYSCQKNFILGIGDVNTHRDTNLYGSTLRAGSSLEPALPGQVSADTSVDVATATAMVGKLEGLNGSTPLSGIYGDSSGTSCSDTSKQCNGYYIAGLAYDSHTKDIRSDISGTQTVNTYWMDVLENQVFKHKNQYWLAAKYGGFDVPTSFQPYASSNGTSTISSSQWRTNTDTLSIGTSSLSYSTDTSGSDPRPDNYFPGNMPDKMQSGLTKAFAKISSELASATSTAFSTISPNISSSGTGSYSATYDPKSWSGTVVGSLVSYASDGTPTLTAKWDARTLLESQGADNRKIVTCCTSGGAGLRFTNSALSTATLNSRTNYASFSAVPNVTNQSASDFVAWLRGDRTKEVVNGGKYRSRTYLLGDIVGAKVNPVGPPDALYYDAYNPGYSTFKKTYKSRKTVVYVGANDGMMHAFDGTVQSSSCTTCGTELFAYIPSFVYGDSTSAGTIGLVSMADPTSYSHHFMVDAKPLSFDINFKNTPGGGGADSANDWRTVLIGGLGKGGRGFFAMDVTNPADWTSEAAVAGKVLWEFTDSHMGYSFGAPIVVKTKKYGWTAIFTSGYNNSDGKGYFFFVNPRTGALLESVATTTGSTSSPLNLAQATAYVSDYTDFTADAVYAGDLQGNIWRVDLTSSSDDYAAPTKIASLVRSSVAQPVTTRVLVEVDPVTKKRYVLVGTGRLLADSDISSSDTQSFYAIADGTEVFGDFYTTATLPSGYTFPLGRANLVNNTSLTAGIGSSPSSPMGWYYDLDVDSATSIAARVNVTPTANAGIVAFAANLPNGQSCSPSGTGKVYATSFGDGKTALVNSDGAAVASTSLNYVVTDIAIQRINGSLRLIAGNANGEVVRVPASLSGSGGTRRLNWRNVTATE